MSWKYLVKLFFFFFFFSFLFLLPHVEVSLARGRTCATATPPYEAQGNPGKPVETIWTWLILQDEPCYYRDREIEREREREIDR